MQHISSDIIEKASQGDLGSFEMIYKAASPFVYNVAYRVVNSREEAEDVTQDVFLTIHRNLKNFRFESSLKTWIYRIAVNCAINQAKKTAKIKDKSVEYDENIVEAKAVTAEKIEMSQEYQSEVVDSLLKVLNPDQKACVVLRNIEGLSYEEIAETLKININTVRSRLKRARETLLAFHKEVTKNEM